MSKKLPRTLKNWRISENVSLREILGWATEQCGADRALLVVGLEVDADPPVAADPTVEEVVRRVFGGNLLSVTLASAWPGTTVIGGGCARVYSGRLDKQVMGRMVSIEDDWTGWLCSRGLPEDLCVWREGAPAPLVMTVTHERFGWLIDDGPVPDWATDDVDESLLGQPEFPPAPLFLTPAETSLVRRRRRRR